MTEEEIADEIKAARRDGAPLRLIGGGTRGALGRPVQPARALSLAAHRGVTLYDPGALTLIAKTGTPMAEIEAMLAAENQMLAFEPMDHRKLLGSEGEPTIGGVVAANISGPRRMQAGACRDFVLGARFVDGRGDIVKNGGRVMKNVTGLDLAKLMTGSYGTLGALTEVSLKVLPKPAAAQTLVFEGLSPTDGAALMRKALATPFEISGAAYLPGDPSRTCLRVEGLETQVDYRAAELSKLFSDQGPNAVTGADHDALWTDIRDVEGFAGDGAVWRVSLKPTDAPALAEALAGRVAAETRFDWAGGLVWARTPGQDGEAEAVRAALAPLGGHATLVRGPASLRDAAFQPEAARLAQVSEALRRQFDPDGVLNPGLMAA